MCIQFILGDGLAYANAAAGRVASPSGIELSIPSAYGMIEESYASPGSETATASPAIIYIQDAHDSLEAQTHISSMVADLVGKQGVRTVFEEGYEGPVPTDDCFKVIEDAKLRQKVSYFYMDKLRLSGAEYAHINRRKDFKLIGADRIQLHLDNIRWYRNSARNRGEILEDLDAISGEMEKLAARFFSPPMKAWMRIKQKFGAGEIPLTDYLKRMTGLAGKIMSPKDFRRHYPSVALVLAAHGSSDSRYIQAVRELDYRGLFLEIETLENDYALFYLKDPMRRKIFGYVRGLGLVRRLNEVKVTPAEFEAVRPTLASLDTKALAQFIAEQSGHTVVLSRSWEEAIRDAVRFYETARSRDAAIEEKLAAFVREGKEKAAVLVYGGFHKDEIRSMLRRLGVSYLIVSPKITSVSKKHQDYYRQLMTAGRHAFETPLAVARSARALSVVERAELRDDGAVTKEMLALAEIFRSADMSHMALLDREVARKMARGEMRATPRDAASQEQLRLNDGIRLLSPLSFDWTYGKSLTTMRTLEESFLKALLGEVDDPRILELMRFIREDATAASYRAFRSQTGWNEMSHYGEPAQAVESFLAAEETRRYFQRLADALPLSSDLDAQRPKIAAIPARVEEAMGPGFSKLKLLTDAACSWLSGRDASSREEVKAIAKQMMTSLARSAGWDLTYLALTSTVSTPFFEELLFRFAVPRALTSAENLTSRRAQALTNKLFVLMHVHRGFPGERLRLYARLSYLNSLAARNFSVLTAFALHAASNFLNGQKIWRKSVEAIGVDRFELLRDTLVNYSVTENSNSDGTFQTRFVVTRREMRQRPLGEQSVALTGAMGHLGSELMDGLLSRVKSVLPVFMKASEFGPYRGYEFENRERMERYVAAKFPADEVQRKIISGRDTLFHLGGRARSIPYPDEAGKPAEYFIATGLLENVVPLAVFVRHAETLSSHPRIVYASSIQVYDLMDWQSVEGPIKETDLKLDAKLRHWVDTTRDFIRLLVIGARFAAMDRLAIRRRLEDYLQTHMPPAQYQYQWYSLSKIVGEAALEQYDNGIALRLTGIYGPGYDPNDEAGMEDRPTDRWVAAAAKGRGMPYRAGVPKNVLFISDAVKALMAAAESDLQGVKVINVGGVRLDSTDEIIAAIRKVSGTGDEILHPADRGPGGKPRPLLDLTLLQSILGLDSSQFVSLEAGVAKTYELYHPQAQPPRTWSNRFFYRDSLQRPEMRLPPFEASTSRVSDLAGPRTEMRLKRMSEDAIHHGADSANQLWPEVWLRRSKIAQDIFQKDWMETKIYENVEEALDPKMGYSYAREMLEKVYEKGDETKAQANLEHAIQFLKDKARGLPNGARKQMLEVIDRLENESNVLALMMPRLFFYSVLDESAKVRYVTLFSRKLRWPWLVWAAGVLEWLLNGLLGFLFIEGGGGRLSERRLRLVQTMPTEEEGEAWYLRKTRISYQRKAIVISLKWLAGINPNDRSQLAILADGLYKAQYLLDAYHRGMTAYWIWSWISNFYMESLRPYLSPFHKTFWDQFLPRRKVQRTYRSINRIREKNAYPQRGLVLGEIPLGRFNSTVIDWIRQDQALRAQSQDDVGKQRDRSFHEIIALERDLEGFDPDLDHPKAMKLRDRIFGLARYQELIGNGYAEEATVKGRAQAIRHYQTALEISTWLRRVDRQGISLYTNEYRRLLFLLRHGDWNAFLEAFKDLASARVFRTMNLSEAQKEDLDGRLNRDLAEILDKTLRRFHYKLEVHRAAYRTDKAKQSEIDRTHFLLDHCYALYRQHLRRPRSGRFTDSTWLEEEFQKIGSEPPPVLSRVWATFTDMVQNYLRSFRSLETFNPMVISRGRPLAAVFNVDGTLLRPNWKSVYGRVYEELLGQKPEESWFVENVYGKSEDDIIENLVRGYSLRFPVGAVKGAHELVTQKLEEVRRAVWRDRAESPVPGITKILGYLRDHNIPVIAVSQADTELAWQHLTEAGLDKWISRENVIGRGTQGRPVDRLVTILDMVQKRPQQTYLYFDDAPEAPARIRIHSLLRRKVVSFGVAHGEGIQLDRSSDQFADAGVNYLVRGRYSLRAFRKLLDPVLSSPSGSGAPIRSETRGLERTDIEGDWSRVRRKADLVRSSVMRAIDDRVYGGNHRILIAELERRKPKKLVKRDLTDLLSRLDMICEATRSEIDARDLEFIDRGEASIRYALEVLGKIGGDYVPDLSAHEEEPPVAGEVRKTVPKLMREDLFSEDQMVRVAMEISALGAEAALALPHYLDSMLMERIMTALLALGLMGPEASGALTRLRELQDQYRAKRGEQWNALRSFIDWAVARVQGRSVSAWPPGIARPEIQKSKASRNEMRSSEAMTGKELHRLLMSVDMPHEGISSITDYHSLLQAARDARLEAGGTVLEVGSQQIFSDILFAALGYRLTVVDDLSESLDLYLTFSPVWERRLKPRLTEAIPGIEIEEAHPFRAYPKMALPSRIRFPSGGEIQWVYERVNFAKMPADSYDSIWAAWLNGGSTVPANLLRQLARLVKPGGSMIFDDANIRSSDAYWRLLQRLERETGKKVANRSAQSVLTLSQWANAGEAVYFEPKGRDERRKVIKTVVNGLRLLGIAGAVINWIVFIGFFGIPQWMILLKFTSVIAMSLWLGTLVALASHYHERPWIKASLIAAAFAGAIAIYAVFGINPGQELTQKIVKGVLLRMAVYGAAGYAAAVVRGLVARIFSSEKVIPIEAASGSEPEASPQESRPSPLRWAFFFAPFNGFFIFFSFLPFINTYVAGDGWKMSFDLSLGTWFASLPLTIVVAEAMIYRRDVLKDFTAMIRARSLKESKTIESFKRLFPYSFIYWFPMLWLMWWLDSLGVVPYVLNHQLFIFIWAALLQPLFDWIDRSVHEEKPEGPSVPSSVGVGDQGNPIPSADGPQSRPELRTTEMPSDFLDLLASEFSGREVIRVLDVGSLSGEYLMSLQKLAAEDGRFKLELHGVDPRWRIGAREQLGALGIAAHDGTVEDLLQRPEFKGRFDLIVVNASEFINIHRAVRQLTEGLAPGGMIAWRFGRYEDVLLGMDLQEGLREKGYPFVRLKNNLIRMPAGGKQWELMPPFFIKRKGEAFVDPGLQRLSHVGTNPQIRAEMRKAEPAAARVVQRVPARVGQQRNFRRVIASISKGQGTVLIPKSDLANLEEEQWTSLYEALYQLSGIRCVVYGKGDESNKTLQFRLEQLRSGRLKDKVVAVNSAAEDAMKRAVPGRQAVFLSIEGLDEKTVSALGTSELVKAVRLKRDYELPWLAALYAVSNGTLQGISVVDRFYLEDPSGWYRAEIKEYLAYQVVAWSA
ncbi:MAG: CPBP family glutamic-type intramembrane protease [Candidatus Omnitrophota bacterium]